MKLRTLIALAAGYYFGSKAGSQRYNQIIFMTRTVANSQTFQNLVRRVGETLASGVEAVTGERPAFASSSEQKEQS